ncbi:MAG: rod shape-determining protein MreC [Gaiellaceae bacterium]
MPRNRSVRLAALGVTAQRTASPSYGSRGGGSFGRRAVVVALVVLALALITGYFREGDSGRFHDAQGSAARVLEPFQIGAERVVRPFRDAWGWFDDLRTAKDENAALRSELHALQVRSAKAAAAPATTRLTGVGKAARAPRWAADYRLLKADVIADLPSYQQVVTVSAGARDGVKRYDPVVSTGGLLLGHISKVGPSSSNVSLINDRSSAVAVVTAPTSTKGILRGRGPDVGLLIDRVSKQDIVNDGDYVITAGRVSSGSFYPRGIWVGLVDGVSQSDTDAFKLVHLKPDADLEGLDQVVIARRTGSLPTLP